MSEFVNYNKRGVALPSGCKNLIDVLRHSNKTNPGRPPGLPFLAPLSGIGKHIALAFESGDLAGLWVTSPDEQLTLFVIGIGGPQCAGVTVQRDTAQERAVREFFMRHDISLPGDSDVPASCVPILPQCNNYVISPLPTEPSILSQLAADLFRAVCGLKSESVMHVHYTDYKDAS